MKFWPSACTYLLLFVSSCIRLIFSQLHWWILLWVPVLPNSSSIWVLTPPPSVPYCLNFNFLGSLSDSNYLPRLKHILPSLLLQFPIICARSCSASGLGWVYLFLWIIDFYFTTECLVREGAIVSYVSAVTAVKMLNICWLEYGGNTSDETGSLGLYWICSNIACVLCFGFFVVSCGILAPQPEIKPAPLLLNGKVLTTGLSGKSRGGLLLLKKKKQNTGLWYPAKQTFPHVSFMIPYHSRNACNLQMFSLNVGWDWQRCP